MNIQLENVCVCVYIYISLYAVPQIFIDKNTCIRAGAHTHSLSKGYICYVYTVPISESQAS